MEGEETLMKTSMRRIMGWLMLIILVVWVSAGIAETSKLTILHINDFHGRILPDAENDPKRPVAGAAHLVAMVKAERAKNPTGTLLLSAGDMFQGSPESNLFHGAPVIEMMNELKFDAMALGNHEFDWGIGVLNGMRRKAAFPFLSANVVNDKGFLMPGMRAYRIVQRNKAKVAVIGVTTQETGYTTKPDNVKDVVFLNPESVVPRLIKEVRAQGATVVVVLSHLGLDADKRLAANVRGIDVIVGGHSHTEIPKPLKAENNTIIVQAGAYGAYLGILELTTDSQTGRVTGFTDTSELKRVSAGPKDKTDRKVALMVKHYEERLNPIFAAVVGETSIDLATYRDRESNLGNLITDAMREASGARVAVQNSGGIRSPIAAGPITMRQAYKTLPFDNLLITMDLTGRQIKTLLEQSESSEHGLMQLSGLTVAYDRKRPAGNRVVKASINGEPVDENKTYRVATNDFLAAGGDRIEVLTRGEFPLRGDNLRDIFVQYLQKHRPVTPRVEGRIVFAE
jgi:5'-nucleotidase / UDP-sugar diphosphatase